MKLIVSCFSCSPSRGSEPGMGWGYLRAAARHHEIWALVDGWEFGDELRKYKNDYAEELENVHFVFVPCKPHPLLRRSWPPSYYWFYNLWHRRAFRIAKRLHSEIGFDAAWKLSMVTFREPGYLWKLPIPFIWGPVGAMGSTDWRMLPVMGVRGILEFAARNIINWWQSRTSFRSRRAARKAASTNSLFAATGENQREMKRLWGVDSQVLCEIGLRELPTLVPDPNGEALRIFWSGVFENRKALPLLLRALQKMEGRWTLDVLGDGPLRDEWHALAERLHVAGDVNWHGWMKRAEALSILKNTDVVAITSIHDLTSTVIVEAMAYGKPVVCIDHCGFADVIDKTCGIKIPVSAPERMACAFASALNRLRDIALRDELSRGARRRAENYLWMNKEKTLLEILGRSVGNA